LFSIVQWRRIASRLLARIGLEASFFGQGSDCNRIAQNDLHCATNTGLIRSGKKKPAVPGGLRAVMTSLARSRRRKNKPENEWPLSTWCYCIGIVAMKEMVVVNMQMSVINSLAYEFTQV
jgi:hypothetical protein